MEVVKYLSEQLVDNKGEVVVAMGEPKDDIKTITIRVAAEDTGKVIGKQGRIATAIRTIVKSIGAKTGERYNVDILDAEGKTKAE
jgi:hypothetical protein